MSLVGCFGDEPRVRSAAMCTAGASAKKLSVMTYNVHLFEIAGAATRVPFLREAIGDTIDFLIGEDGKPVDFLDRERALLIADRIKEMKASPDVVVFTEVWDVDIAQDLIHSLKDTYSSHYFPDAEHDIFDGKALGSGLILLSKYPLYEDSAVFKPFEKLGGDDAFAAKGIGQVTLQVCEGPRATVFMTHTQATYADENGVVDDSNTLDNIRQMGEMAAAHKVKYPKDAVIMAGDLNIAENSSSYEKMMTELNSVDALREYYGNDVPAFTYDEATNKLIKLFYQGERDNPLRMRLDYIMYGKEGTISRALSVSGEGLNSHFYFTHPTTKEKLPLSDHYPVLVEFETFVAP